MSFLPKSTRLRAIGSILLVAGFSILSQAQNLQDPLPTDPNVLKGKFANGLTYYVRPNSKPEKKVELRLVVKAGSTLETEEQRGLAHFLEHMNFNGLKHFEKNELVSYLQSIGVEFGADLNAYTAFDQTVYILPIPTDKPGNLDKGFQIIEDWAHSALLTDKDIDEERGVVLEESRLGKGAEMRMLDKYFPKLAGGSLYAQRLPIGKDEVLKNFKPDVIRSYYRDWYRPDLQAVAIVGDIDTATAMNYLRKHFAGLKNPANARKREYVEVKPRSAPEAMVVTDREATNTSLILMFPYEKKDVERIAGDYRKTLVRNLALQMLNRRFSDLANGANPPFPYAFAGFDDMIHGYEAFMAQTMVSSEGLKEPLDALAGELIKARQHGFTQSELEVARKGMMSFIEKAYNERNTTESRNYVEEYVRNFLDNEPIPGIEKEYEYYKNWLPGITLAELNAEAKSWMKNDNIFTLVTGPEDMKSKLPNDAALVAMTSTAMKQSVKATEETKVNTELMAKKPTPGTTVDIKQEKDLGATTYTLSNGIKVTVKTTDFKSDEILLKGLRKGGASQYAPADIRNAKFASNVVDAMGIGTFTPTELSKAKAGRTARVSVDIDDKESKVEGSSSVKDFEIMLQLLHLQMTAPRKDTGLFKSFVKKSKQQLMFMSANPQIAYFDTTLKVLFQGSPYAPIVVPKPQDYDAINLDRALEIYKKELGTADGFHFFIVGNIAPEIAKPVIETYLGSIQKSGQMPAIKDNGLRPVSGKMRLNITKGKEKQSMIMAIYHGDAVYSESLALKAQALGEILNIKVIEELREKMGSIYGGGFSAGLEKEPYPHYSIGMQLPCGPDKVDTLLSASTSEINKIKATGPDPKDLDKVKTQWHEKHRESIKTNSYWTGQLADIMVWGKDRSYLLDYDAQVDKLTPADIQQTAKKLFDGKNEFVSVLYPEASAEDKDETEGSK